MTRQGAVRVGPGEVGRRVSLRRVVDVLDGRPRFADVVGELVAWSGGVVAVRRRDGSVVELAESTLVAGKVVPAARTRTDELQEVTARGWPAPDEEWLGRWLLRAADGFTG